MNQTSPSPGAPGAVGDLLRTVFDDNADPILVLSTEGQVLLANASAHELVGDGVVGASFGVPASSGQTAEIDLLSATGRRVAELRMVESSMDGTPVYVATLRDITDRVRAEQSLRSFVGTASHEFRTPLFAIAGFAETLLDTRESLPDESIDRYLRIIHRQANRLARLVDDLLSLARLDEGAVEPNRATTLLAVAAEGAVAMSSGDAVVAVDPDATALVDPDHLEEMLINLIGNALKYGAPPIEVLVRPGPEDTHVDLLVRDHGDGVPAAFRDRMFDRFSRDRRSAGSTHGAGLGLAIVAGLATRNRAEISYEDTEGGGATFVLRLERP